ncbi:MAG: TetR/AcrR family transcriptional regulator [Rhodoferax sp.]|nr:TetR/AcrR family transcriptional regulator [Rhodoferax sp.]
MPGPINLCKIAATVRAKSARRKGARPGELLAAALSLFVEKGFAATRAEEIARRAGVSKGTLFLYFSSKEDLFKAVVRENLSGHYPEWRARLEAFEGSTADLLRTFMQQWWDRVGDTPASGITKLMASEASNFPDLAAFYQKEVIEPGEALIRTILERGVQKGEFRPIDMQYGVYTVLAPMLFLAMWKHSFGSNALRVGRLVPEDYLSVQVETILNGLAAGPTLPPLRKPSDSDPTTHEDLEPSPSPRAQRSGPGCTQVRDGVTASTMTPPVQGKKSK